MRLIIHFLWYYLITQFYILYELELIDKIKCNIFNSNYCELLIYSIFKQMSYFAIKLNK